MPSQCYYRRHLRNWHLPKRTTYAIEFQQGPHAFSKQSRLGCRTGVACDRVVILGQQHRQQARFALKAPKGSSQQRRTVGRSTDPLGCKEPLAIEITLQSWSNVSGPLCAIERSWVESDLLHSLFTDELAAAALFDAVSQLNFLRVLQCSQTRAFEGMVGQCG